MFVDKQKLNKEYLSEITKLGNLMDTINISYFVIGKYAIYSYGIIPRKSAPCEIIIYPEKNKKKLINMLFKLGYIIKELGADKIIIFKNTPSGDLHIVLYFMLATENNYEFAIDSKKIKLNIKDLSTERKEIQVNKLGKGYYRVAPLEVIIFTKMGASTEDELFELEALSTSDKVDVDRLIKIFETNDLI